MRQKNVDIGTTPAEIVKKRAQKGKKGDKTKAVRYLDTMDDQFKEVSNCVSLWQKFQWLQVDLNTERKTVSVITDTSTAVTIVPERCYKQYVPHVKYMKTNATAHLQRVKAESTWKSRSVSRPGRKRDHFARSGNERNVDARSHGNGAPEKTEDKLDSSIKFVQEQTSGA